MAAITGFHHIMISVPDVKATQAFYTNVLGLETEFEFTGGVMLRAADGVHLEVMAGGEDHTNQQGFKHIALATDDVDGMVARVREAGYAITVEPMDHTFDSEPAVKVRLAFFRGPSQETVELFHVY